MAASDDRLKAYERSVRLKDLNLEARGRDPVGVADALLTGGVRPWRTKAAP